MAERQRLSASQSESARDRGEHESQRDSLARLADELNGRQSDLDQMRRKVEADAQAVIEQTQLLKSRTEQLELRLAKQAATDADLRRREETVHASHVELQRISQELGPKQQKLDRWEQEIAARAAKLEQQAEELVRTRETLAAMQAQLTHDHQEIAGSEELTPRGRSR